MITDYGVKGILHKALGVQPQSTNLAAIPKRVDSQLPAGSSEKLDFLGAVPAMRQWIGARSAKTPLSFNYSVSLNKYEDTLLIPLDWIKNDKTGNVQSSMSSLATRYRIDWPAALVAALLNNAASGTAYDGVAFISDSRTIGDSGTIDNNLTYDASATPTAQEAAAAILQAFNQMTGFKDDRGQPCNEDMTDVTVVACGGTGAAAALRQACVDSILLGTTPAPNPVMGLGVNIRFVASPRITIGSGLGWFLINTSPNACPLAFIENTGEFLVSTKGAGSDFEHDNDAWEMGLKAVGAAAYGRPQDVVYTLFN